MKTTGKLVVHPTKKVIGYFKKNGEFIRLTDKQLDDLYQTMNDLRPEK